MLPWVQLHLPLARAQDAAPIGRLSGDDVSVTNAVAFDIEYGRSTAILASGSDITVRSGQALIHLEEGGEIAVCGPAHFSVLKSGDAITIALDYGRVHPMLDAKVQLTVFTPQVVVTPVAIGDGPRDLTVGLTPEGAMCALPASGAMRIEQQLSGQRMLVPQGGTLHMEGERLSTTREPSESCTCELMVTRNAEPSPKNLEMSVPVRPSGSRPSPNAATPPAVHEEPVYKVLMPALTFDSSAPDPPPEPDPETILLVREARVQPELIFRGYVQPAPAPTAAKPPDAPVQVAEKPKPKRPNIFVRFLNLFRRNRPASADANGNSASPAL